MPFRHLLFNRRNGAPVRPTDFVPPTLESVHDFSLENEFHQQQWSDQRNGSPAPSSANSFGQPDWVQMHMLKPQSQTSLWLENNAQFAQPMMAQQVQHNQQWPVSQPNSYQDFQMRNHDHHVDNMDTDVSSISHGSMHSSVSSSFDLRFDEEDAATMSSNSRRQSVTSLSDSPNGPQVSKLCPLLTGQVGRCEPSLCGPDAPCLTFNNVTPPIEDCITMPNTSHMFEEEFDRNGRPMSATNTLDMTSAQKPQLIKSAQTTPQTSTTSLNAQERTARSRGRRPGVKVTAACTNDMTAAESRLMKKSKARQAHSLVERKYRENLNAKIQELHEKLQSTRIGAKNMSSSQTLDDSDADHDRFEQASSSKSSSKIKKSDVLVEAMDYVSASESELQNMSEEISRLNERVAMLENMVRQEHIRMTPTNTMGDFGFNMGR